MRSVVVRNICHLQKRPSGECNFELSIIAEFFFQTSLCVCYIYLLPKYG